MSLNSSPPHAQSEPRYLYRGKKYSIALSNSKGLVIGDNNTVTNYFSEGVDAKSLHKPFVATFGLLAIVLIVLFVGFGTLLAFNPNFWAWIAPQPMQGRFNIAVAGFVTNEPSLESFRTLAAQEITRELISQFEKSDVRVDIWDADKTGKMEGATAEARAIAAAHRASEINAHLIVYGTVSKSGNLTVVVPEFYLVNQNFFASQELTGQYELGAPIELQEYDDFARRTKLGDELVARTRAFARISTGLAYALDAKYEKAQREFEGALEVKDWSETKGKQVLYLLIGNLLVVQKKYDDATGMYEQALALDPEYARPYLGLGNIAVLQTLKSGVHADDATRLLAEAEKNFLNARQAKHQPALSDIESKVHFGMGQVQMIRKLAGQLSDFAPAIAEYQAVIADFETNENLRLTWYAAEAHARLGAIALVEKRCDEAKKQYMIAKSLHEDTKAGGEFKIAKEYEKKLNTWNSNPSLCQSVGGGLTSG